eukprot:11221726-Lingulodinium_polyedra.AAC.1
MERAPLQHARSMRGPKLVYACSAQMCNFRAAEVANGRFNHIAAQRVATAARRCDQIYCSPSPRLAHRTLARS